ncbi:hypothetical protein SAMN05216436_102118 [bacterium A37T11]|nr:hypothetical protein SAMN05216436_102118 [bacterium A37T11]
MKTLAYELDFLEQQLALSISGKLEQPLELVLKEELNRLPKAFLHAVPGQHKKILKAYFGLHYHRLRHWSDQLFKQKNPVLALIEELDTLLQFMEDHLADYLPKMKALPRYRASALLINVKEQAEILQLQLVEKGVDDRLMLVITDSITFRGQSSKKISKRRFSYAARLAERIGYALEADATPEKWQEKLISLLMEANLNGTAFYHYMLAYTKAGLNRDLPLYDQQRYYLLQQQEVMAYADEGKKGYKSGKPPIAVQLYRAFDYELATLRRLEKISNRLENKVDPIYLFRTCLSARQFAMFVRILINVGIILVDEPQRLFDFVCRHFRSIGTEKMSAENFKKNSYKKLARDVERVEEVIEEMAEESVRLKA